MKRISSPPTGKTLFFKTLPLPKSRRIEYLAKTAVCIKLVSWIFSRNCLDIFLEVDDLRLIWFGVKYIPCRKVVFGDPWTQILKVILTSCAKVFAWQRALHLFLGQFWLGLFLGRRNRNVGLFALCGWINLTYLDGFASVSTISLVCKTEQLGMIGHDFGTSKTGEQKHNQADWF